MQKASRRGILIALSATAGCLVTAFARAQSGVPGPASKAAQPSPEGHLNFAAEAERMRREAVSRGDQSYGAVVVLGAAVVGWGPSRVVADRNPNAHAERVAVWDAQARLGRKDLTGAVLYSTSHPCRACEAAAAGAGISRMRWGPKAVDAGAPRG